MNRLALLILFALALPGLAEEKNLEKRVMDLSNELRCLVCQNQTLADSNAPLAVDLRNTVREQLKSGKSEREVVAFMTERYGDFVLYRPPFKASTALLWVGPFLLLALGIFFLFRNLRARRKQEEQPLSDDERARAAALLDRPRE